MKKGDHDSGLWVSTATVVTLSSAQPHPSGMINSIMFALQETISMPLVITEQGTIRIKGSRVSLDSIVHHFKLGATAEQIVQSFLLSASATFTPVLLTTSRIAKKLKSI